MGASNDQMYLLELTVENVKFDCDVLCRLKDLEGDICLAFSFMNNGPYVVYMGDGFSSHKCIKIPKSCMFVLSTEEMECFIELLNIKLELYKKLSKPTLPDTCPIGVSRIPITNLFGDIQCKLECENGPLYKTNMRDCFNIVDQKSNDVIGEFTAFIKLSCFGSMESTTIEAFAGDAPCGNNKSVRYDLSKNQKNMRNFCEEARPECPPSPMPQSACCFPPPPCPPPPCPPPSCRPPLTCPSTPCCGIPCPKPYCCPSAPNCQLMKPSIPRFSACRGIPQPDQPPRPEFTPPCAVVPVPCNPPYCCHPPCNMPMPQCVPPPESAPPIGAPIPPCTQRNPPCCSLPCDYGPKTCPCLQKCRYVQTTKKSKGKKGKGKKGKRKGKKKK